MRRLGNRVLSALMALALAVGMCPAPALAAVSSSEDMFLDCAILVGGNGTCYNADHVDADYARIDGGDGLPGYFTGKATNTGSDVETQPADNPASETAGNAEAQPPSTTTTETDGNAAAQPAGNPSIEPSATTETAAADATVKAGQTVTVSGASYKVTATGKKASVAYSKAPKSKKSVTVPATVKVDGKSYKVTSIAANAFKGSKATKVTVGKNVAKIAKGA